MELEKQRKYRYWTVYDTMPASSNKCRLIFCGMVPEHRPEVTDGRHKVCRGCGHIILQLIRETYNTYLQQQQQQKQQTDQHVQKKQKI